MELKQQFLTAFPNSFFLENQGPLVEEYLRTQGWIEPTEKVLDLEKPGEGNMNYVLRRGTIFSDIGS